MTRLLAIIIASLALTGAHAQEATSGEVVIDLASFGLQGLTRPGDWAGIRLSVTDRGDQPREVMIRMTLTDADGDHPTPTRIIATNPGVTQGVWLYAWLPPRDAAGPFEVTANLALPQDDATYRPGRLLGTAVIAPSRQLPPPEASLIAILGSRYMELNQYAETYQGQNFPPATHEQILFTKDIRPDQLPDQWIGLEPFSALVWAEGDPIQLSSERVQAIREWIQRGGHLVVVLPRVGQTWFTERNPLIDILPDVRVTREDGVDLEDYRPLLVDRTREFVILPDNASVHHFEVREGADPEAAIPILNGPHGRTVVVRRIVGHGAVTLVGLDLNDPILAQRAAIDPDVFWHRVLGRRGDLMTQQEMLTLARNPGADRLTFPGRSTVAFDDALDSEIAKTGRAAAGVLLGFVVFVLFWILAGPGGFAILKSTGRVKHAWVAYALTTVLFTVIAWGGATAIRPAHVDVTYIRMLDHVYGQPLQRARTWASVLIPSYGESTISIGAPDDDRFDNAITPWEPPSMDAVSGGFPDARAYPVDSADLSSITVPTRATVKQVLADWAGDPAWAMPIPLAAEGEGTGHIRLLTEQERTAIDVPQGYNKPDLAGHLVHNLPAPLDDVVIIVVKGQDRLPPPRASLTRLPGGQLLADARAYKVTQPWQPGVALDLTQATSVLLRDAGDLSARAYLEEILPKSTTAGLAPRASDVDLTRRLTALALYTMLQPPDPASRVATNATPIVSRRQTHLWDLGRWFTQPCVIIIGHIPDLRDPPDGPAPIYVDAKPAPMRGRTVVRWVYPLPPDPPDFPIQPQVPGQ